MPGRLLLQNGEPLSAYNTQLQECRQLRGVKEKQCKALVRSGPLRLHGFKARLLYTFRATA